MGNRINKRTHSDYTQSAAYLPKDLVKDFKRLALELEVGHSEAMEQAIRMWCDAAIKKVNQSQ
jgi:Ribbon-helix-helix protein, copG family